MTAPRKSATPRRKTKPKQPQRLIRTSERTNFKRCRWMWDRGYNDRLKPIVERPALRFGTLIHAALEKRYPPGIKRGPKPAETFQKLYAKELKEVEAKWGFRDADGEWSDALGLGVDMLEGYVETYGRDEDWEVIASEMTFKVPVYGRQEDSGLWVPSVKGESGSKVLFHYVGTMDGVWKNRMDGGVRINDYKTTSKDPTKEGGGKAVLDEQATAYWAWGVDWLIAKKILKPRDQQALDGMLYTFLYKAKRDERTVDAHGHALNKDGTVSRRQPTPRFHRDIVYRAEHDRNEARQRAIQEVGEMNMVKAGTLQPYKTPETGAMGHCSWCQFNDICELHEVGADWEALRDATMEEWEPYGAHEIKEEGKR